MRRLPRLIYLFAILSSLIAALCMAGAVLAEGPPPPEVCPLTTSSHSARVLTPVLRTRVGEKAHVKMALEPPEIPSGFFVTTLVDVLGAPPGALGESRPRVLPGFPRIAIKASIPGQYTLAIRVNMVAKSSCGGIKAATISELEVLVEVEP